MSYVKIAAVGSVGVLLLEMMLFMVLGSVAQARQLGSFSIDLGPVPFVSLVRDASGGSSFTTGWGVLAAAVVLGLLNGLGAYALSRRSAG